MKRAILVLWLFAGSQLSFGAVIHVPSEQPAIQAGIDAAIDGDTVLVADGHYFERLNLLAKSLLITSEILLDNDTSHIANTIIDADTNVIGASDTGSVIYAWGYPEYNGPVEVRGFTLQSGVGGGEGCVKAWLSDMTIRHCSIAGNSGVAKIGNGTHLTFDSTAIRDCPAGVDAANSYALSCRFTACTLDSIPMCFHGCDVYFTSCIANGCYISAYSTTWPIGMSIESSLLRQCDISLAIDGRLEISNSEIYELDLSVRACLVDVENLIVTGEMTFNDFQSWWLSATNSTFIGDIIHDLQSASHGSGYITLVNSVFMTDSPRLFDCNDERVYTISATCCDIVCGDSIWIDVQPPSTLDTSDVFFDDPLFCDNLVNDFRLSDLSPCLPGNNSCGVLIGALGMGCGSPYVCGDADGSGVVDIDDAIYLINYVYLSGPVPNPVSAGDVNCDSKIDLLDIVGIVNYIFRGGNAPCDANGDDVPDC
ncbi:MAG: dockerin type I repeat-containing protein [Candidatus Zixiibacteriota bacterium]